MDYNYGQGPRLRLLYVLHVHGGVRRNVAWMRLYSQSIPFINNTVTGMFDKKHDMPKIFNNKYADPYSYRTYDKYYLEFRTKKPLYPTLKFTSLKDGSVKYLAKKWTAPRVYTYENAPDRITIERNITSWILTSNERCHLEIRIYDREFTGSVPDDTYYSGGIFRNFDHEYQYYSGDNPSKRGLQNMNMSITGINNVASIRTNSTLIRCVTPLKNIEPDVSTEDYLGNYKSGVFQKCQTWR